MTTLFVTGSALISPCGLYRYELRRVWDAATPPVCWVMLNPSTADADTDDPTIRRVVAFARLWGYGGIRVVNLFAFRATDPKDMLRASDPVGPENDQAIIDACAGEFAVAAWGVNAPADRVKHVVELMQSNALSLDCLGLTRDGHPRHPLFVAGATKRISYPGAKPCS